MVAACEATRPQAAPDPQGNRPAALVCRPPERWIMTERDDDPPFDARAFDVFLPQGPEAPLLIDSPHSGRCYPGDFQTLVPALVLRGAEEWMVDDLFGAAPMEGATLLAADRKSKRRNSNH